MTQVRFTDIDAQYGLPRGTLDAVWTIESGRGTNRGPSRSADGRLVGARGHFQFMPDTAAEISRRSGHDPFSDNPEEASRAAGFYLQQLRAQFHGDIGKALAAYNAGPTRVRRAEERASANGGNWLAFMPAETRNYVPPTLARLNGSRLNGSLDYQQAVEDNGGVDPHTVEEREAEETRRRETLRQSGLQQSTVNQMSSKDVMGMLFFAIMIALFSGKAKEVNQNVAAGLSQESPAPATPDPASPPPADQPAANAPAPATTETPAATTPALPQPATPTGGAAPSLPVVDTSIVSPPAVTPRGSPPAAATTSPPPPPSGRPPSGRTPNP